MPLSVSERFNSLSAGLFCRLWIFSKQTFLKISFRNTIRVSNSLDSDQVRRFCLCVLFLSGSKLFAKLISRRQSGRLRQFFIVLL